MTGVEGWLDPPFVGTPNPIILGGLDPLGPIILGYLDPSLGGWTPDMQPNESRSSTQGTEAAPIKLSLEFEFVGPGDELGYHQAMLNLILYRS